MGIDLHQHSKGFSIQFLKFVLGKGIYQNRNVGIPCGVRSRSHTMLEDITGEGEL